MGLSICKAMQKVWLQGQSNTFMCEVAHAIFRHLMGAMHVRLARAFIGNNLGTDTRAVPGAQA